MKLQQCIIQCKVYTLCIIHHRGMLFLELLLPSLVWPWQFTQHSCTEKLKNSTVYDTPRSCDLAVYHTPRSCNAMHCSKCSRRISSCRLPVMFPKNLFLLPTTHVPEDSIFGASHSCSLRICSFCLPFMFQKNLFLLPIIHVSEKCVLATYHSCSRGICSCYLPFMFQKNLFLMPTIHVPEEPVLGIKEWVALGGEDRQVLHVAPGQLGTETSLDPNLVMYNKDVCYL